MQNGNIFKRYENGGNIEEICEDAQHGRNGSITKKRRGKFGRNALFPKNE